MFVVPADLKYTRTGHFNSSPYCVILRATDIMKGKTVVEDARVCINSNISLIHAVEMLPEPEKLRASESKNKKNRKVISSNLVTAEDMKVSGSSSMPVVQFPDVAEILQNASYLARVVEPLQPINEAKIK